MGRDETGKHLIAAGALAAAIGVASAHVQQQEAAAIFEWFEYQGRDSLFDRPLSHDQYRNPILAGYYPDPSIVRVGEDFYLVNSTFGFYPGIPVHHSRDLVNWTQIGNVIDRPDMMPFDGLHLGYNGIYAPTIEYHDGVFYVITTCVGCGGDFVVTATDPAGPWSDPTWLPHIGGIDPSLFFDDDGKVYIVHHKDPKKKQYDAHTGIWIMEVDPATFEARSNDVMLVDGAVDQPWHTEYIEGPHMYEMGGKYLLWFPGGGTGYYHGQLVYKGKDPFGPFTPYPGNPVLTQFGLPDDRQDPVTATGHADLFEDGHGNWWTAFLGTRVYDLETPPQDPGRFHTGRETFLLPVSFQDGWPVVLDPGEAVPVIAQRPNLPRHESPDVPTTGNFTFREEFDDDTLAPQWIFIRTPHHKWWTTGDGALRLTPSGNAVGEKGQPAFIGRRLQHMNATFDTKMRFLPETATASAGLLAIQNSEHYLTFGLEQSKDGQPVLRIRKRDGAQDPARGRILREVVVEGASEVPLYLRISVDRALIDFAYSLDGETYCTTLEDADSSVLTTYRAGGFTGAVVGMYTSK